MKSEEWLEAHRDLIVKRWRERLKPLVEGEQVPELEERVTACFQQLQRLIAGEGVYLATEEIEEKLFNCPELGTHEHHQLSAWILASGRRVIGDVTKDEGDREAQDCARACEGVISYLQHSLRINVCQDCTIATCCMRGEILEPMPNGLEE